MRWDGKRKQQLTRFASRNTSSPAWSPNGKRIAFDRSGQGNFEPGIHIWSMKANGSGNKQLTTTGADIFDTNPAYFPNGKKLVFQSDRNDTLDDFSDGELITMNADGSNQKFLTQDSDFQGDPNFAPNGRRIIIEIEDGIGSISKNGSGFDLLMNPAATGLSGDDPVYSPNGKLIAFDAEVDDIDDDNDRLYIAKANGNKRRAKTRAGIDVDDVDWGVRVG